MTTPQSDRILERLGRLHPKLIDLSLGRVERLLAALGNPQHRLPPVIHVAGTNGKGSTVATLRACLEAGGYRVHAFTKPHLVRFHERIRLDGRLIDEEALIALLEECERANGGTPITYFEITTAAAFLAFARTPADVVLLETGLGGRLDATNVVLRPAVTAITPISLDHQAFLGDTIAAIAGEKAGILKPGVPAVVGPQPEEAEAVIEARALGLGAPLSRWQARVALRRGRRRHALRRRALAARSAVAVAARYAPDRECGGGDCVPRAVARLRAVAGSHRRRVAANRMAGAVTASDPRPAGRDDAARLGAVARRRTQSRRRRDPRRICRGLARSSALSRRRHAEYQGCRRFPRLPWCLTPKHWPA